ncbi:beta strand repeat-containing protein [Sulfobacillus harzensis]|uniref:Big-1 domain-containing protein n=1 Tax=Sulfobacillus harzensis TaxID=2729629 RepID=A0A7Y0Q421_9FIRM|nr:hypothetical protein [Sulfobacillus harzensis]NMP23566.1 hypothetical protein [Sulfobacillus harzensis]
MQKQTMKKVAPLALGSTMMVLSMVPAASAFAATGNPYVTGLSVSAKGDSVTAMAKTSGHYVVEYEFKAENSKGQWIITRSYQPNPNYTAPSWATHVQGFAMTEYELGHKQWNMKRPSNVVAVKPASTTNPIVGVTEVVSGNTATAVASTNGKHNVVYEFKVQAPDSNTWQIQGPYSSTPTYTYKQTKAGTYKIEAFALTATEYANHEWGMKVKSNVSNLTIAAGTPVGVKLSAASSSVVADGVATDTITAAVVDEYGNTVTDYNGTVSVSVTSGTGSLSTGTVTIKDGVGTFTISASTTGTDAIGTNDLVASNGTPTPATFSYGSTTVTAVTPTIQGIKVSASSQAVSENSSNNDPVTITLTDQAGNPVPSAYAGEGAKDVTVTLSGPGSLGTSAATVSGATTSQTVYVWPGYSGTEDVYSIQGLTGTITVTASAPGVTPGQTSINAVTVGQPAKIAVSATTGSLTSSLTVSGDTLPSGTTFTQYTVTLEDINGNTVAAPSGGDALTLSDNATTGDLYYYVASSATGQPSGTALPASSGSYSGSYSGSIASGQSTYTFDVINTAAQSGTAAITVKDALTSSTVTVPYTFEIGQASQLGVTGPGDVETNGTATYTAQVEDAAKNATTDGSAAVTFTLSGAPSGTTFANGSTTYVTTLNGNGAASVTVDAGAAASTSAYTVSASVSGLTTGDATGIVTAPASYVSQIGVYSGTQTAPSASALIPSSGVSLNGLGTGTFTLFEENGVDQAQTATDNLKVTSSNPSVVMVRSSATTPASGGVLSVAATSFSGTSATFSLIGGDQGTATITVTDASNPTVAPVSFTVTVGSLSSGAISTTAANESGLANQAGGTAYFTLNGQTVSATYASSASDFGSYNNGVFAVTPPALYSAVAAPSGSTATSATSGDTLAVWPGAVSGTYTYVDLSQETPGAGSQLGHAYVGLNIQGPSGSTVTLSVNGGSYDTNSTNTDSAYFTVATEASVGSWTLASPQEVQLNAKVTFSNGVSVTYPLMVQEP